MTNVKRFHCERTKFERIARLERNHLHLIQQPRLFEFDFQQTAREGSGINRSGKSGCDMLNRSGMIFVPVRDNDGPNMKIVALRQEFEVRDNVIDPQHIIFRKHDAGVDNDRFRAVLECHHIFADFSKPAQGNEVQRRAVHNILSLSSHFH